MRILAGCGALGLLLVTVLGCGLGVSIEETSPDGRFVASVVNSPSLDPPRQSLWLGEVGRRRVKLFELGEDQEWCSQIAWAERRSANERASFPIVAFAVEPPRAIVVDAESRHIVLDRRLPNDATWTTDSSFGGFRLVHSHDSPGGLILRYQVCRRGDLDCPSETGPWAELSIPST